METIRRVFSVDRREINYIRLTVESYDGMAVVRTIDPHAASIEVLIAPGCEETVIELLGDICQREGVRLEPFDNEIISGG